MRITGTEDIKLNNTVVSVGKFDCFHKGHQLIFETAAQMKEPGMEQVIFMFDTNPADAVNHRIGRYIVSQKERRPLSRMYGVDHCIEYPFNDKTRNMSPEDFVRDVLVAKLGVSAVVAGDDFRFGKDRAGDINTLKELGEKYGFSVKIVERISYKGQIISSTLIRDELLKGNISDVNAMLGRPYSICGLILKGNHVGTEMGIPTINLKVPEDKLLPPFGVYITETIVRNDIMKSITNIGVRPTFYPEGEVFVETNILGFNGDIYGEEATVYFREFIRPEIKFSSPSQLYSQIARDIETTDEYFRK